HAGRGGWTWYTGSAGWMYRVGLEEILGLERRGAAFSIDPCIPATWPGFKVLWKSEGATFEIEVDNQARRCRGVARALCDGRPVDPGPIPLAADGRTHRIQVVMGEPDKDAQSLQEGAAALA